MPAPNTDTTHFTAIMTEDNIKFLNNFLSGHFQIILKMLTMDSANLEKLITNITADDDKDAFISLLSNTGKILPALTADFDLLLARIEKLCDEKGL